MGLTWYSGLTIFFAILSIMEQICIYFFIGYPYLYGFRLNKWNCPDIAGSITRYTNENLLPGMAESRSIRLVYEIIEDKYIYIRYKNPKSIGSLWLFCANVNIPNSSVVNVRVNSFSMLFYASLINCSFWIPSPVVAVAVLVFMYFFISYIYDEFLKELRRLFCVV